MNGLHPCTLSQQAPFAVVRRVSPLCAAFCPTCEECAQHNGKSLRCADVRNNKIAIQQSDCDFERRRSGLDELSRSRGSEVYGARADEGASIAFG